MVGKISVLIGDLVRPAALASRNGKKQVQEEGKKGGVCFFQKKKNKRHKKTYRR